MSQSPAPGQILDALESSVHLVRPGEVLVLTFGHPLDDDEYAEMSGRAHAALDGTGIRCLILDDATVDVARAGDAA